MASHACSLRAAAPRSAHQGAPAGRWSPLIAPAARRRPAQRRAGSLQPRSAGEGGTRSPPPTAPDLQQQLRELDRLLVSCRGLPVLGWRCWPPAT